MRAQSIVPILKLSLLESSELVAQFGDATEPIELVAKSYAIAGEVSLQLLSDEITLEQCEGVLRQMSCRVVGSQALNNLTFCLLRSLAAPTAKS